MAPIAPIAPIAPKATRQGRHRNHYNPAQRIAALGVTSKSIREWATDQDLDAPTRGVLPAHLLDAYEAAHQQTAAAS
ncbi:Lsr2 family DNA-binding protein [Nocardioides psychrotolerans]